MPAFSAPRHTGATSMRSITPPLMSSMKPIPVQPADDTASITTMPGVRKSMYEPPSKPGICVTALNSAPNSSSQMIGWISVMPR